MASRGFGQVLALGPCGREHYATVKLAKVRAAAAALPPHDSYEIPPLLKLVRYAVVETGTLSQEKFSELARVLHSVQTERRSSEEVQLAPLHFSLRHLLCAILYDGGKEVSDLPGHRFWTRQGRRDRLRNAERSVVDASFPSCAD